MFEGYQDDVIDFIKSLMYAEEDLGVHMVPIVDTSVKGRVTYDKMPEGAPVQELISLALIGIRIGKKLVTVSYHNTIMKSDNGEPVTRKERAVILEFITFLKDLCNESYISLGASFDSAGHNRIQGVDPSTLEPTFYLEVGGMYMQADDISEFIPH